MIMRQYRHKPVSQYLLPVQRCLGSTITLWQLTLSLPLHSTFREAKTRLKISTHVAFPKKAALRNALVSMFIHGAKLNCPGPLYKFNHTLTSSSLWRHFCLALMAEWLQMIWECVSTVSQPTQVHCPALIASHKCCLYGEVPVLLCFCCCPPEAQPQVRGGCVAGRKIVAYACNPA